MNQKITRSFEISFLVCASAAAGLVWIACDAQKAEKDCTVDEDCHGDLVCDQGTGTCVAPSEPFARPESHLSLAGPDTLSAGNSASFLAIFDQLPALQVWYRFEVDEEEIKTASESRSWTYRPGLDDVGEHVIKVIAEADLPDEEETPADDAGTSSNDGATSSGDAAPSGEEKALTTWEASITVTVEAVELPIDRPDVDLSGPAYLNADTIASYTAKAVAAAEQTLYFRMLLDGAEVAPWTAGTAIDGSFFGITWDYAPDAADPNVVGTHRITGEVAVDASGPAVDAAVFTVQVGQAAPQVNVNLTGDPTISESTTHIYVAHLDAEQKDIDYEFRFLLLDNGSPDNARLVQAWSSKREYSYTPDTLSAGYYTLHVEVSEKTEQRTVLATASYDITVEDVPDKAGVTLQGPHQLVEGTAGSWTAIGVNPSGSSDDMFYRFTLTGYNLLPENPQEEDPSLWRRQYVRDWAPDNTFEKGFDFFHGNDESPPQDTGYAAYNLVVESALRANGFVVATASINNIQVANANQPSTNVTLQKDVEVDNENNNVRITLTATASDPDISFANPDQIKESAFDTIYFRFWLEDKVVFTPDTAPSLLPPWHGVWLTDEIGDGSCGYKCNDQASHSPYVPDEERAARGVYKLEWTIWGYNLPPQPTSSPDVEFPLGTRRVLVEISDNGDAETRVPLEENEITFSISRPTPPTE